MDEHLHDWVFHFNPYTKIWAAIPRHLYQDYWSDSKTKGILRSSSFDTLQSLLAKTKGDEEALDKLVK